MNRGVSDRRLLKLAAFLRTLPRKRFDYGNWVGPDWQGDPTLSCGTTACAFGWAAAMPEFRRAGLRIKAVSFEAVSWEESDPMFRPVFYVGKKAHDDAIGAAMEFFGIGPADAQYLFYPSAVVGRSATPKQVAAHIERFVKNRKSFVKMASLSA